MYSDTELPPAKFLKVSLKLTPASRVAEIRCQHDRALRLPPLPGLPPRQEVHPAGGAALLRGLLRGPLRQHVRGVRQADRLRLQGLVLQGPALARGLFPLLAVQGLPCGQAVRRQGGPAALHRLLLTGVLVPLPGVQEEHHARLGGSWFQCQGTRKMEYKGSSWHETCFICHRCQQPIGTKSFIPKDGQNFCVPCYERQYALQCVQCKKPITSGGVTYREQPWHRECFVCTACKKPLSGQRFTSRDEFAYCLGCFCDLYAKKCAGCASPISGLGGTKYISFEERQWHNDCFNCKKCSLSLVGRGFLTERDDILCPDCGKDI
ncbi:four and a half LIM domains protein 2 isoform X3 [Physeter macrocephalus]|uniref:Four and a half LIM domains protein 2 isoform X3 n=1 Tax=Physeter macrocephalus TaxID=9755 RepID=A0A455BV54_PHYMC|nr:four and a half LIM domains protein 2 isoform X3 [Physeter catodon]|eukprot:XP_028352869.1 four and a half LIM domains protein 2 isoform X3 [Physeter catodon]